MPHDKYGRKISVGDVIKAKPYNYERRGTEAVGRVVAMREGQQCSGDAAFFTSFGAGGHVSALPVVDAFGAEEATLVLMADGSMPEPVKRASEA